MSEYIPDYTISFDFADLSGFDKAVMKMEAYENAFYTGLIKGVQRFEVLAERRLEKILVNEGLASTGLIEGITSEITDSGITLTVRTKAIDPDGTDYAMFLEYGVGVKGSGTNHPKLPSGWTYGTGKTIRPDGSWLFPIHGDDPYPVVSYYNGRPYSITKGGYEGHMFMWKLYEYARLQFRRTLNLYIKKEIEKLGGVGK
jgi:hypothetical protein